MTRQKRTRAVGISPDLTAEKAALIKGMLERGDRQSDIAAYFQINQGRIYEIKFGQKFAGIRPVIQDDLPPKGPYVVVSKVVYERAKLSEDILRTVSAIMEQSLVDMRTRLNAALAESE